MIFLFSSQFFIPLRSLSRTSLSYISATLANHSSYILFLFFTLCLSLSTCATVSLSRSLCLYLCLSLSFRISLCLLFALSLSLFLSITYHRHKAVRNIRPCEQPNCRRGGDEYLTERAHWETLRRCQRWMGQYSSCYSRWLFCSCVGRERLSRSHDGFRWPQGNKQMSYYFLAIGVEGVRGGEGRIWDQFMFSSLSLYH